MKFSAIKLLGFVYILTLFSCASTPPTWLVDYNSEYPDNQYIAQGGNGDSLEFAKTNALQNLAQYFQTTVDASMTSQLKTMAQGEEYFEQRSTLTDVQVTSQIDLFGVEFNEPYYNKADKQWYVIAYIHRETAWKQYKPKIDDKKNMFYAMYNQAENQQDAFTLYRFYNQAWKEGQAFLETLEFGRLLMADVDQRYRTDKAVVASLPAILQEKALACSMQILVTGDFEDIFTATVKDEFSNMGFLVSEESGAYILNLKVTENSSQQADLYAVFPTADVSLVTQDGKTVYSTQHRGDRSVASNLDVAKRRGFQKAAKELAVEIQNDFKDF